MNRSQQSPVSSSRSDAGATAVEYALLLFGIFLAVILAVTALGIHVRALFQLVPPGL